MHRGDMEKYIKVRKAQAEGVRTVEELKEKSDIVIDNDTEIQEIEKILQNACKCKNVSISEVVSAVKNGADTFEKVAETTGAGTSQPGGGVANQPCCLAAGCECQYGTELPIRTCQHQIGGDCGSECIQYFVQYQPGHAAL